jgi:uncharacterized membrane protein YvbJ
MYCAKCGADNLEEAKFCGKCGEAMSGGASPSVPGANQTPGAQAGTKAPVSSGLKLLLLIAVAVAVGSCILFGIIASLAETGSYPY